MTIIYLLLLCNAVFLLTSCFPLQTYGSLQDVLVSFGRRTLCYPLHRHFDMVSAAVRDVSSILLSGELQTVRCTPVKFPQLAFTKTFLFHLVLFVCFVLSHFHLNCELVTWPCAIHGLTCKSQCKSCWMTFLTYTPMQICIKNLLMEASNLFRPNLRGFLIALFGLCAILAVMEMI